jgi:ABC-type uncharacterized transport system ATPase subunit
LQTILRDLNRKGATFIAATHDAAVTEYTTRVVHIRDGRIVMGLDIAGLKETKEMREARMKLQLQYKETAERTVLRQVQDAIKEKVFEIRIAKLREKISEETINNLPMYFDDMIKEMVETSQIEGKVDSGVLYLKKPAE